MTAVRSKAWWDFAPHEGAEGLKPSSVGGTLAASWVFQTQASFAGSALATAVTTKITTRLTEDKRSLVLINPGATLVHLGVPAAAPGSDAQVYIGYIELSDFLIGDSLELGIIQKGKKPLAAMSLPVAFPL